MDFEAIQLLIPLVAVMYWSWFLVLAISVSHGFAVYHTDVLYRKTYNVSGLSDDALFGFSVSSMATGNKSKLIVGAPKQDDIGGVYACDPSTRVCSPVSRKIIHRNNEDYRYNNQSYWFGATVSGTKDFFVACAPRFVAKSLIYAKSVGIFGRCYSYDDSSAKPVLLDSVPRYMLETIHPFETTMQTFGWSLNIDSDNSIYVGGPGMASGRLLRIKSNKVENAGYAFGNYSKFSASYNFGYSVTTGEFKPMGKNLESRMQVAVGSTYGIDGRGKVIFRPLIDISMRSTNQLVGPTVGSMYGAALCTASFNEDGKRSALLVGAPAFADYDGYNTGAVYVYTVAKREGFLPNPITMFAGEAPNSFFGSAILNVGDINEDQKDDIAVAAPYYQNTGCVYIYSGAHLAMDGNKPAPLQKIRPSSPGTRTFGYSLGLLKDYDDNGCDELAIGAPESNEVTVLNCIAVITVKLLKLPNAITKIKGDESKFIDVCLEVQFPVKPEKVNAEIKVEIAIRHDDGASLQVPANGRLDFTIDKKNETLICKKIELFLNGTGKYNKEIFYDMKATRVPPKDKDFRPENVDLSVKSELSVAGLIWAQECGNGTCSPQLNMSTEYSQESLYLIGSTSSIDTSILVSNTGDVAYDACMHINVSGAEITKLPNNCHTLASAILECKPRQPVYNTQKWDQAISIDTTSLTNENSMVSVTVTLFNECGNAPRIRNEHEFTLVADADSIYIQGRTDEGVDNMVNLTRGDIAAQKQFHHVYTIGNSGPTNWVNVPLNLTVPKLDIATAAVYLANEKCKVFGSSGDIDVYSCKADSISKDTAIQVDIIFTVVPDTLNAKIGREDIMVKSKINVILNGFEKSAEVKSELRLVEGVIPIWIIIVASILALIILVIIFFILKECGCLKRKNKEQLKKVRMSVRRQTMMRKSMLGRPQSADQETLVREAEASHESDKKKKDRRVIINDF